MERALRYVEAHQQQQHTLAVLAEHLELSPFHLQRLFQRWAGVSPKRFLQFLTKEHAKRLLEQGATSAETARAVGLSGTGRLHDLLVVTEALTPGEYRRGGSGLLLRYGTHDTPFGPCLVACSERGLCGLEFVLTMDASPPERLRQRYPGAELCMEPDVAAPVVQRMFGADSGSTQTVVLRGRPFELKVWQALLELPEGHVVSYGQLAESLGKPAAARAVGRALGQNPIAYLIPCHRVIHSLGQPGNYCWGPLRKAAMLGWEAARRSECRD